MSWNCPACGALENQDESIRCLCGYELARQGGVVDASEPASAGTTSQDDRGLEAAPPPVTADTEPAKPKRTGILALLAVAGTVILKAFKPLLIGFKFLKLGAILKTGVTMIVSMWAYALTWGWAFAAVFVLLIFIHEMGHALALKRFGVNAGAPVFIPFVGAFIAMKEMPKDVRVEAWTAIAGPVAGTVGAIGCCAIGIATGNTFWVAAAFTGFFLNLFNLIPLSPLDGGRVVAAISPKLWIFGFIGILLLFLNSWNPILFFILIPAGRNVYQLWKNRKTAEQGDYYAVDRKTKALIAGCYFALLAFLPLAMALTHVKR